MSFSYFTFLYHPIRSLAFIALILAFLSLWIHKRTWIWGTFLTISCVFAFYGKLIDFKVFIFLILLGGLYMTLAANIHGSMRAIVLLGTCIISFSLMTHLLPGFHNWKLMKDVYISENAYPYTFYLNYDKPFVGFFPLVFTIPLLQMKDPSMKLQSAFLIVIGIMIMMLLSLYFGVVDIDIKFPHSWLIFLIANFFFVTIPEEAFFRGLLQQEIDTFFHKKKWSGVLSVIVVSIVFAIFHLGFIKDVNFIFLTFVASLIYGTIYQFTHCIESSILCHYLFNSIHFFCFTYPALRAQ